MATTNIRTSEARIWRSPGAQFVALAALGFAPVLIETLRGSNEIYDFWEYSATLRQLMLHPGNPGNPLLALPTPSAFFSPYLLVIAVGANATGTGPVHALAVVGIFNYWLLMWGIWRFTTIFSAHRQTPVCALLFIWFLWGPSPWKYSGFFDYRTLSDVAAYPSTFATGCGMLLASLWPKVLEAERLRAVGAMVLVGVALAFIELTHPIAGDMTGAALLCLTVTSAVPSRAGRLLAGVTVVGAVLCIAWPYFSFLRLVGDEAAFDPGNQAMYVGWVVHAAPLFLAFGLLWRRSATLLGWRLLVYLVPLAVLYTFGAITGDYSQGRTISPLIIGVQIGLADAAVTFGLPMVVRLRGGVLAALIAAVALLGVAELVNNRGGFKASVPGTGSAATTYAAYKQAVDGLPFTGTIMAPVNDGMEAAIPTYAARLVATHRALAFVTTEPARLATVTEFYAPAATPTFRASTIRRYDVRYILAPAESTALIHQLAGFGHVIRRGAMFDTIVVTVRS